MEKTANHLEKLHEASMEILEKTGIKIHHPEILDIIRKNGIKISGDVVFFTGDQVMEWIAKAPNQFTLHARNPVYDMQIGGTASYYGAGYGCPAIIQADGVRRDALFEDYLTFLKLIHQSSCFNINAGVVVQPNDVPPAQSFPLMMYSAIQHTDKCLIGIPGSADDVRKVMDIVGIVFGGPDALKEAPRVITLVNTTSPLQIDRIALSTMMVCAEYGQPIIVSPGPIAGATGPITLAGNIAMGNAEALAGVVIAQMIREGTPVVYGLQATTADMATGGISIGSPGFSLETAYGARLAKMYGLPCRGGGNSSDAKGVGVQSGYESMLAMLVSCQENVNLIFHSAGILDAYGAMSYEQFFADIEIIRMIEYYLKGIETDSEALALDVIREVGPGGQFLMNGHTMKHCRTAPWLPEISVRGPLNGYTAREALFNKIERKKTAMLDSYEKPELDNDIQNNLSAYMKKIGIDESMLRAAGV